MIDKNNFRDLINYILIFGLLILTAIILYPIVYPIIYGILFAYIFYPVHRWLSRKMNNEFLSALFICIGIFLILLGLLAIFFTTAFKQAVEFYVLLQKTDTLEILKKVIPEFISSSSASEPIMNSLNTYVSNLIATYISSLSSAISDIPILMIKIAVVIFAFFFGLKDGRKAIEYIKSLSPLKKEVEEKFFKQFKEITNSVLVGQIIVGIVQGAMAGIGYFIFGVPNALLLTMITIVAAIIPVIGPWLVWVPVDIYLFASGRSSAGIGLLIYGILVVSWIDNVLRLMILSRKTTINTGIVMIGMFGGLFVFGFIGLIIGPLILAYVLLVLELYRKSNVGEELIFKKQEE